MAIISIGSYNGRDVKYSDVTQKFTMNPYDGNSAMKAITGWNNTELSVQELSDSHNGVTIFAGRSDYSGIASGFKLRLAPVGAVFTATEKIEWKKYVDRDPVITQLLVKLSKEDMTDNGDGTYYIDVNYDVDKTYKYEQLSQTERWYFPENGPFDTTYTQTISFTDTDTGHTTTESYNIEYTETSAITKPWEDIATVAFQFDDSLAPIPNYIDQTDGQTATPTIGPDYSGTLVTTGNKVTVQNPMNLFNTAPGTDFTWTGKHYCFPYANQKTAGRTSYNWDNSGGNGYFDMHGSWSFEYDVVRTGPQSQTEYDDLSGENPYQHLLYVSDGVDQVLADCIVSLYDYEYAYDASNAYPNVVVTGTYCAMPAKPSETIRNYKCFVSYEYDAILDQGTVTVTYYHKYKNTFLTPTTTILSSPLARSATNDVSFNGGFTNVGDGFQQASHKGLGGFVYYDNAVIDPQNTEWMYYSCYYFDRTLMLGDSWTKTHGLDANTEGYSNRMLQLMQNDGLSRYKSIVTHYAQDYHYTTPPGTVVPTWVNDYGEMPSTGDLNDFISMLDSRIHPSKVMLAYTGINHALIHYASKTGNPVWGDVQWSAPAYYALEHINALESRGIPWLIWDSCPSDVVLDTEPAPQEDLIGRHEDPNYSWYGIVSATNTINTYDVTNDPANNGRILPAIALGDGAHLIEAGYQLLGDYLYTNHANILP